MYYSNILLKKLTKSAKKEIEKAVKKVVQEYGDVLIKLGDHTTDTEKIGYLRGMFDGEGCITKQGKVIFSNTNKDLIDIIERYLIELGFHLYIKKEKKRNPHWKPCYRLFICARDEVMKFYEIIGTDVEGKKERFEKLLAEVNIG